MPSGRAFGEPSRRHKPYCYCVLVRLFTVWSMPPGFGMLLLPPTEQPYAPPLPPKKTRRRRLLVLPLFHII